MQLPAPCFNVFERGRSEPPATIDLAMNLTSGRLHQPPPVQLPAPCFNVFERDRSASRTHFCATCMLPHLGLQLTPDAVYTSPGGVRLARLWEWLLSGCYAAAPAAAALVRCSRHLARWGGGAGLDFCGLGLVQVLTASMPA